MSALVGLANDAMRKKVERRRRKLPFLFWSIGRRLSRGEAIGAGL